MDVTGARSLLAVIASCKHDNGEEGEVEGCMGILRQNTGTHRFVI